MPSLAGGTVFPRDGGITLASHSGVEWDLSVWSVVGPADSPVVGGIEAGLGGLFCTGDNCTVAHCCNWSCCCSFVG